MVIDGDAGKADFAVSFEVVEGTLPLIAIRPARIPHVKLLKIDGFDLQVAKTLLGGADYVIVGKDTVDIGSGGGRPDPVHRRDLGRDYHGVRRLPEGFSDQRLAVS